jgi:hypothetical protein
VRGVKYLRLATLMTLLLGACAGEPESRPATFAYISEAILAPACAVGGCHTTTAKTSGYSFETLDESRAALVKLTKGVACPQPGSGKGNGGGHNLLETIGAMSCVPRKMMPPDQTLPEADLALIRQWADAGFTGLQ